MRGGDHGARVRWAEKLLLLAFALTLHVGCKKSSKRSEAEPQPAIDTSRACASLTRLECYRATHCILEATAPARYVCRNPKGECEKTQPKYDKAKCESNPRCVFQPANCYCPFAGYGQTKVPDPPAKSGGACVCGGGSPARCTARTASDAGASD